MPRVLLGGLGERLEHLADVLLGDLENHLPAAGHIANPQERFTRLNRLVRQLLAEILREHAPSRMSPLRRPNDRGGHQELAGAAQVAVKRVFVIGERIANSLAVDARLGEILLAGIAVRGRKVFDVPR